MKRQISRVQLMKMQRSTYVNYETTRNKAIGNVFII